VEDGCFKSSEDHNGCAYYLHSGDGESCPSGNARVGARRASPNDLNVTYETLLGCLELSDKHRRNLRERGLSDSEINRRQYRSKVATTAG
jgi:hypothetical protein